VQIDSESKLQQVPERRRVWKALVLAVLLIVLVIAVFWAAGEMIFRHGAAPLPEGADSGQVSSLRLRNLDGEFEVVAIDVGRAQGMRPTLDHCQRTMAVDPERPGQESHVECGVGNRRVDFGERL